MNTKLLIFFIAIATMVIATATASADPGPRYWPPAKIQQITEPFIQARSPFPGIAVLKEQRTGFLWVKDLGHLFRKNRREQVAEVERLNQSSSLKVRVATAADIKRLNNYIEGGLNVFAIGLFDPSKMIINKYGSTFSWLSWYKSRRRGSAWSVFGLYYVQARDGKKTAITRRGHMYKGLIKDPYDWYDMGQSRDYGMWVIIED